MTLILSSLSLLAGCGAKNSEYSPEPKRQSVAEATVPSEEKRVISAEETLSYFDGFRNDDVYSMRLEEIVANVTDQIGQDITTPDDVWVSVIDLKPPFPTISNFQGGELVDPASVVKVPYMVATYHQLQNGDLTLTPELERDLVKMIEVSDNRATNRILERLTNTTDGESLPDDEMKEFREKRYTVNRYFDSVGLPGIFAINKTYSTGIRLYGREFEMLGERSGDNYEYSNKLTTNETAKLMAAVYESKIVGTQESAKMRALLYRDEVNTFLSDTEYPGIAKTFSKGGSTGLCRHDAVIFEFEQEAPLVIVAFSKTRNVGERERPRVIEEICEAILADLRLE